VKVITLPVAPRPFEWHRWQALTWMEAVLPGARAAFSTRLGGVSEGAYRELNIGLLTDDDPQLVRHNRALLAAAVDRDPSGVAIGLQVHGTEICTRREPPAPSAYAERLTAPAKADAQLTDHVAVTPLVLVADCFPLVLATPGAVAAVHCGWRGIAAGIVASAVQSLCHLRATEPAEVGAAVGPGIGPCCYEVGPEVERAFAERGHGQEVAGRGRLDLAGAIRSELEQAGLPSQSVHAAGLCTSCHPDLFFSHRRDGGVTGRQAGLAWLT